MGVEEFSSKTGWNKRCNPEDIAELAKALSKAQSEVEGAKKDKKNDHFRSKYADLASIWDACRVPLTKNGLSVCQFPCEAPLGHVGLVTRILHTSGQSLSERFFMPVKDPTNPQAVGSALTYARRYALAAVVGVCPDDDDGNAATRAEAPRAEPVKPDNINVLIQGFESQFSSAKDLLAKKTVYSAVRNSAIPEPGKTRLMARFAEEIKVSK